MNREEFTQTISNKLKLIRTEQGFSQEKMAGVLGISKKTLVEIEKNRAVLGFPCAATVALLFEDGEVMEMILGGDVIESLKSLALDKTEGKEHTWGGRLWWKEISAKSGYKIQQNLISLHYRILTADDRRVCSSFDTEYIESKFEELTGGRDNG
jgi:DNA-binding XRE family transcriptional regulator